MLEKEHKSHLYYSLKKDSKLNLKSNHEISKEIALKIFEFL